MSMQFSIYLCLFLSHLYVFVSSLVVCKGQVQPNSLCLKYIFSLGSAKVSSAFFQITNINETKEKLSNSTLKRLLTQLVLLWMAPFTLSDLFDRCFDLYAGLPHSDRCFDMSWINYNLDLLGCTVSCGWEQCTWSVGECTCVGEEQRNRPLFVHV